MEWQQVMGFHHVAKLGSFTRAAEATYRTQSALTQQIKALETEFDCRLFERIGRRKIVLTPAGERFFRFSESLIGQHSRLVEDLSEFKKLKKGRLRLAAPLTTLYHLFPKTIRKYKRRFPWVEMSLFDMPQKEVTESVRNGDVDYGVAVESLVPGDLDKRAWKKVEPVLLAKSGHPLTKTRGIDLEDIAKFPLILPPKSGDQPYRGRLEGLFAMRGISYNSAMESSNIELSSLYVEMGLGVCFASIVKGLRAFKGKNLKCIPLSHVLAPEYLCVISRKDKYPAALHESFVDMLLAG